MRRRPMRRWLVDRHGGGSVGPVVRRMRVRSMVSSAAITGVVRVMHQDVAVTRWTDMSVVR